MVNFKSIKFQIVALGVALVMAGTLIRHFVALPLVQEQVRELVAAQQLSIATYVAYDIDHSITERLALIQRLAAEFPLELTAQPEQLNAWIKARQRINPVFTNGLLALPPNGPGLLAEYPVVAGRSRLDYTESDWFRAALRDGRAVMGKPVRGRASGDPMIIFAAPVRDAAGRVVIVLAGVALLDAPGFLDGMQQTRLGASGGFLLISPADQLFVASSDPAMILKPTPPPGVNLLHDRAMAGHRGTGVTINAKGVEELSAMVTVPSTGWFVVARIPTAEAFRSVEVLRGVFVKGSGVVLIVLLVTLLIALPRILRPLTDAARAMRDMADGKRELAPLAVARDDEVGKLVRGFNVLVARLRTEQAAREASEARLEFLAHHDSLTGLSNRAMLEDRLAQALARAERAGSQIALLFCDMDGFKQVNDQYGHDAGDAVLRIIAERLTDGRRRTDTVARLGGDEFVILLTDLEDASVAAHSVAQQCLVAVREPFEFEGHTITLSMSIGIALHAGVVVAPSYLMSQADVAMYRAKHAGKGGFFFIEELNGGKPAAASAATSLRRLPVR